MSRNFKSITLVIIALSLSGCAATQMAISKRALEVENKTSASIFLDPVPNSMKTVYIQVRNTSDHNDFSIYPELVAQLQAKGYRVTSDLANAHYLLQASILQVGKTDPSAAQQALLGGYGSALSGALAGSALGALVSASNANGALTGGVAGGLFATIADNLVKDVVYSAITDVQISERIKGKILEKHHAQLKQGESGEVEQVAQSNTNWQRYRTRVLSRAEKVNLKFADALPKLKDGLSKVIAGFF